MTSDVSIIIPSFQRSHLLKWGLLSLAKQDIPFKFETIVLNDGIHDDTEAVCKQYQQKLNLKYVFTGQRNLNGGEIKWRIPGFALNIGIKLSDGDIIIICEPEMFHINSTITLLTIPLMADHKLLGIPKGIDDQDGSILNHIENNHGYLDLNLLNNNYPILHTHNPFLMSINRQEFFNIGGYDEDFIGIAYDDNDLIYRLQKNSCRYYQTEAETVHLYHKRKVYGNDAKARKQLNESLYKERRKEVIRNQNREWGKAPED